MSVKKGPPARDLSIWRVPQQEICMVTSSGFRSSFWSGSSLLLWAHTLILSLLSLSSSYTGLVVFLCMCACPVASVMSDSATPWTVAYQAPPFMGFSRQKYWNGLLFPSPGDLPNPGLPHCRQRLYHLSHQWSPREVLIWIKVKFLHSGSLHFFNQELFLCPLFVSHC